MDDKSPTFVHLFQVSFQDTSTMVVPLTLGIIGAIIDIISKLSKNIQLYGLLEEEKSSTSK